MPVARIAQTARLQVRYQVGSTKRACLSPTRTLANVRLTATTRPCGSAAAISGLQNTRGRSAQSGQRRAAEA